MWEYDGFTRQTESRHKGGNEMIGTRRYTTAFYLLIALALVLSLGIVAVPMAGTAGSNGEVTLLEEDFNSGPGTWEMLNFGGGCTWDTENPRPRPGFDGCSGTFMMADSEDCGTGMSMNTSLVSPPIDCSAYSTILLEFDHHFEYSEAEKGDVDVWDGTTWHNKAQYRAGSGGDVTIDISDVAAGRSEVKVRWYYYDAMDALYWQVDNVEVSGSLSPPPPEEEVMFSSQDFEDELPAGWEVGIGDAAWRLDNPENRTAEGGCADRFMIADCDVCPNVTMNTSLVTPPIDCSEYSTVMLEFDHFFCYCPGCGEEKAEVDVWDGLGWSNELRYEEAAAAGHVAKDISDAAAGESAVKIRWHYYDACNDGFWEVDNFSLFGPPPLVAAFSATPISGCAPLAVNFTDQSTGSPTSWNWIFGDGGTSTAQNPSHQYAGAGTYDVTLTVTNTYGSNSTIKTNFITVSEPVPVGGEAYPVNEASVLARWVAAVALLAGGAAVGAAWLALRRRGARS